MFVVRYSLTAHAQHEGSWTAGELDCGEIGWSRKELLPLLSDAIGFREEHTWHLRREKVDILCWLDLRKKIDSLLQNRNTTFQTYFISLVKSTLTSIVSSNCIGV